MLKKTERLDRRLFSQYFNKGKRNHSAYTTIISLPYLGFLCAVVVGKKVFKQAHERNNIKRQVYSVVEEVKKSEEVKGVYIIILKPAISKLTKREVKEVINKEFGMAVK